jgi:hypothetical protein
VPARPSGKARQRKALGSEDGRMRVSGTLRVWSRGKKLSICTELCVWRAALQLQLYSEIQSVPRSKHIQSRLQKPVS